MMNEIDKYFTFQSNKIKNLNNVKIKKKLFFIFKSKLAGYLNFFEAVRFFNRLKKLNKLLC